MADPDLIASYDFALPDELIALHPVSPRSASRLLVVDPASATLTDRLVSALPSLLQPGDLLVFNETRVLQSRLQVRRQTGARLEALVVGFGREGDWSDPHTPAVALLRGAGSVRPGEALLLDDGSAVTMLDRTDDGMVRLAFAGSVLDCFDRLGLPPLPPYIRSGRKARGEAETSSEDRERYQTSFAATGAAVAAPTAGLHFDEPLLGALDAAGIRRTAVRLHVGIGTFRPVERARLSDHPMHAERYEIPDAALAAIEAARAGGGRVVAVGTTVVRTLESHFGAMQGPLSGTTDLLIRPGYRFAAVDALFTNFHQPKSTLLALVSAFAGYDLMQRAYAQALAERYRFLSYGDAMFIPVRGAAS